MRSTQWLVVVAVAGLVGAGRLEAQQLHPNLPEPVTLSGPAFDNVFDGAILDTPSSAPTVAYSIPVDQNHICFVQIMATVVDLANGAINAVAAGGVSAVCGRAAGNLVVATGAASLAVTTFTAPQPALTLVANTTTQAVDVVVTGRPGQLLRWNIDIQYRLTK